MAMLVDSDTSIFGHKLLAAKPAPSSSPQETASFFPSNNGRIPAVDQILRRKAKLQNIKSSFKYACLSGALVLVICVDFCRGSIVRFFEEEYLVLWYARDMLWYAECLLGMICSINFVAYVASALWARFWQQPVSVTPKEMKLLHIAENDPGFGLRTPTKPGPPDTSWRGVESFVLPSATSSPLANSLLSATANDMSAASWASSPGSFGGNASLSSSSWAYYPAANSSLERSGFWERSSASGPGGTTPEGLRWRGSPPGRWHVTDERSLEAYLAAQEEADRSVSCELPESTAMLTPPRLGTEAVLSRLDHYQTATRSPQTKDGDNPDSATTFSGDSVWRKWAIDEARLDRWVENLRKYMSLSIVKRVASEIDTINSTLQRLGSSDLRVEKANQSTLQQLALSKGQHVPTLAALLPFLDLNSNHEYLVQRIKELARGGCMADFQWNAGSQNYRGKPWCDSLPTDSAIVLHLLCTYLDSRLPPDPRFPDGKTFTSQFFHKTPNKPSDAKDALYIYQTSVLPPHYRLVVGEETWDPPKGRNNLFYVILLFLHCIKTKYGGMLKRINLGLSGVNILWVVDG